MDKQQDTPAKPRRPRPSRRALLHSLKHTIKSIEEDFEGHPAEVRRYLHGIRLVFLGVDGYTEHHRIAEEAYQRAAAAQQAHSDAIAAAERQRHFGPAVGAGDGDTYVPR